MPARLRKRNPSASTSTTRPSFRRTVTECARAQTKAELVRRVTGRADARAARSPRRPSAGPAFRCQPSACALGLRQTRVQSSGRPLRSPWARRTRSRRRARGWRPAGPPF